MLITTENKAIIRIIGKPSKPYIRKISIIFICIISLSAISILLPFLGMKITDKHIPKFKISYFNNTNFAEIMNNISMDVGNISRIFDQTMFFIITGI
jgi:hypothetical protein